MIDHVNLEIIERTRGNPNDLLALNKRAAHRAMEALNEMGLSNC